MANQYSNEFKEDAVNYVKDHPELSVATCAKNLGINVNTLHGWLHKVREGSEFRGQGNYKSDKDKEIARLKRELRDATDALEILKKHSRSSTSKIRELHFSRRIRANPLRSR